MWAPDRDREGQRSQVNPLPPSQKRKTCREREGSAAQPFANAKHCPRSRWSKLASANTTTSSQCDGQGARPSRMRRSRRDREEQSACTRKMQQHQIFGKVQVSDGVLGICSEPRARKRT